MALDIKKYKKRLIEERDRLGRELGLIMESAGPVTDDSQLTAANAPVIEMKDVEARIKDIKSRRLERVNAALQAIDDGTYGVCIKCGKQIDKRRLDAEPAALTCLECLPEDERDFQPPEM